MAGYLRHSCPAWSGVQPSGKPAGYCGPMLGVGGTEPQVTGQHCHKRQCNGEAAVLESLGWVAKGTAGILRERRENDSGGLF